MPKRSLSATLKGPKTIPGVKKTCFFRPVRRRPKHGILLKHGPNPLLDLLVIAVLKMMARPRMLAPLAEGLRPMVVWMSQCPKPLAAARVGERIV